MKESGGFEPPQAPPWLRHCLKAETIADKLIEMFCTFGIPHRIHADNQSGFKSELLTAVRSKLGIEMNFSAPFHFQSHGIVERANQTIERMLQKFMTENSSKWGVLIKYLCCAYNQTPHTGTQISPAELVFGHRTRGILDIARETWTDGDPASKQLKMSTTTYIEQLRENIETALAAARQNTTKAEERMKRNYDKNSSVRSLEPGELALVLIPTTANKLMARWRGPYKVLRRLENGNYELEVGRRKAILHINSLRKFHVAEHDGDNASTNCMIVTDGDAETEEERLAVIPELIERGDKTPLTEVTIGKQLSAEQQAQLRDLLSNYPDVFSGKPGRTDLTEHKIRVTEDVAIYQTPYHIPETMREPVEKELQLMLDCGIIEYDSETTYNSPLIVVRKPDGGVRLVNNFIQLNKITVDEKYPMPNASELLSRVAGAKYLSRIDLNRFFFQIPLEQNSRRYTGFQTPFGSFRYLTLPMGLRTSSATAQRLIDRVLRGAHRYAASLMDDLMVFDTNWDSHLMHVKDILDRLRSAGLTANCKKTILASNKVKILGHVVEDGCIYPDDEKVRVVQNWKVPSNKKQL